MILHRNWWKFWSLDTDVLIILSIISSKNEKGLNSNNNRSKPEFFQATLGYRLFQIGCVFANMIS